MNSHFFCPPACINSITTHFLSLWQTFDKGTCKKELISFQNLNLNCTINGYIHCRSYIVLSSYNVLQKRRKNWNENHSTLKRFNMTFLLKSVFIIAFVSLTLGLVPDEKCLDKAHKSLCTKFFATDLNYCLNESKLEFDHVSSIQ